MLAIWKCSDAVWAHWAGEEGQQDPFRGREEMLATVPDSGSVAAHKFHVHKLLIVGFTA